MTAAEKKNTFHYNCRIVEFKNSKLDQWKIAEGLLRIEETSKCILEMWVKKLIVLGQKLNKWELINKQYK